jgi:uncharacterized protein
VTHLLLDSAILILVLAAQWRMGRMLLAALERHRSAGAVRAARALLPVAALALVGGYLLGFTEFRALLPFTSPLLAVFSGAAELWLFTASSVYGLYLLVRLAPGRDRFDPGRRQLINAAGGALVASPFLLVGYGGLIERTSFRVRQVDVPIPGLHPDLDGLRLLQLSDIHLSPFLSEQELARAIGLANELKPHLALITGDLISSRGDPLDACLRRLATLKTDAGAVGCLGNHEHFAGAERYTTEQGARQGIRFLRQQNIPLRFGAAVLNVAGVDYQRMSARHTGYLRGADRLIAPGAVNLLLSHNPDVFPIAAQQGWDLTVAGHTHGGQVNIEILSREFNPARFFTLYVYGLYRLERAGRTAAAYVSRGIGTIGIPARVGAPPEISLLRLRKA